MDNKDLLLKNLSDYLQIELSDYDKERVMGYVGEYNKDIPPVIIYRDKVIYKTIVEVDKPLKMVTQDDLEREALIICNNRGIVYNRFIKPPHGKVDAEVLDARKEFCSHILTHYICTQNRLKEFFKVHHATISYYMVGKKIRRIKPQQKQTA